ncbi:MucR family transcriptional regulator [Mesorhizobium sp. 131-3-5]|uniref:MucR family transcriptional regulator n=1 Tax=Mesorhizobium sp. 131-3-5 TaxID=2744520 RepID=UPI00406D090F
MCLEDGKRFKSLKRHRACTRASHQMNSGHSGALASDYPMVAPNYAAARSFEPVERYRLSPDSSICQFRLRRSG